MAVEAISLVQSRFNSVHSSGQYDINPEAFAELVGVAVNQVLSVQFFH